jgi:hypothetical protein
VTQREAVAEYQSTEWAQPTDSVKYIKEDVILSTHI